MVIANLVALIGVDLSKIFALMRKAQTIKYFRGRGSIFFSTS